MTSPTDEKPEYHSKSEMRRLEAQKPDISAGGYISVNREEAITKNLDKIKAMTLPKADEKPTPYPGKESAYSVSEKPVAREWTIFKFESEDDYGEDVSGPNTGGRIRVIEHSAYLAVVKERDELQKDSAAAWDKCEERRLESDQLGARLENQVAWLEDYRAKLTEAEARVSELEKRFGPSETVQRLVERHSRKDWWAVINVERMEGTISKYDRKVQYEQNVMHLNLVDKDLLLEAQAKLTAAEAEIERLKALNSCKAIQVVGDRMIALAIERDQLKATTADQNWEPMQKAQARIAELEQQYQELYEITHEQMNEDAARLAVARKACEKLGGWMSAALSDPAVYAEMKADIIEWFKALEETK